MSTCLADSSTGKSQSPSGPPGKRLLSLPRLPCAGHGSVLRLEAGNQRCLSVRWPQPVVQSVSSVLSLKHVLSPAALLYCRGLHLGPRTVTSHVDSGESLRPGHSSGVDAPQFVLCTSATAVFARHILDHITQLLKTYLFITSA
uniref:Uncharacterized protein n=1 Tax=Molossus molossus TaxID=27622 RepID=A0A7J8CRQ1_MOLMO|nr:hypothetical protein HJG59_009740 [Molossus molossus]